MPAVDRPWRDTWPRPARPGDGNAWLTGSCWLYCRRAGVPVLWVGSVTTPGAKGDVYACGTCLAELDHIVRLQAHGRDEAGALPCGHRRIERRGGKAYCAGCKRQVYL
ncbi:hypothetical protein [Streptomyces beihaiensis]|uniref:Uncharacterized protein n=1 Tax=Streptomyces beihaiensis TaxID=2984495 RepID=A0ABT3TUT5_9ACTN|nr:hypothetical protein [Streptomyces beihaiensis]MCX3060802.1 hypothetical protein [Streptomyces beihaiensis]